jgi:hypothetical protein
MFMRFLGGGVGHKVTEFVQQIRPESICMATERSKPDIQDEGITAEHIEDQLQVEGRVLDEDDDMEDVDLDEEVDFGYADDVGSRVDESEQDMDSESDGDGDKL